jgi:hypothetical protein
MIIRFFVTAVFIAGGITAAISEENTENKNITLVTTQSTADGKSKIRKDILEECIVSLPSAGALQATVTSKPVFLKEINGKSDKNAFQKMYTATIEINYMLYHKWLVIVTTSSVQGQEPVIKEVEGKIKKTKTFSSDPGSGDSYAGRSRRQYYFSSEEAAVKDARDRAQVWLKQQQAVVCKD